MTSKAQTAKQAGDKTPGHQAASPTSQELAVREVPLSLSVQRAIRDLPAASVGDVRALQSTYGNRAVLGLLRGASVSRPVIQAKLRVGPANDSYEREADSVADRVMSMSIAETKSVQRMGPEDDDLAGAEPTVQRRMEGGFEVGSDLEQRLAASKGGGTPLPAQTREFMQPRFGADFSGVRVHTGSGAAQMSHELGAQAFTHGQDIYMGANKCDPGSSAGKHLLAHELTHVIQQGGGGALQRARDEDPIDDNEDRGESTSRAEGETATVQRQGASGTVQRNGVTFPSYATIVGDGTVKKEAKAAWKETKEATTETKRREQGFWIRWNSKDDKFSVTGKVTGTEVANDKTAKITFGAKPADAGDEYTVGSFHTHTPTTHREYGRKVGPSGADGRADTSDNVAGVVYDYKPTVGANIPKGHPLDSGAKLWHSGPDSRT